MNDDKNEARPSVETQQVQEPRRGRPPGTVRPSNMVKVTILLDPDDAQWAKALPEGVSGMVRRLMSEERAKGTKR